MPITLELFQRNCNVADSTGAISSLIVTFYSPLKNPQASDWLARANIACPFFDKDIYATGEDPAQAFFSLPGAVVNYLIGKRRQGYDAFWFERGDIDYQDFWTYVK